MMALTRYYTAHYGKAAMISNDLGEGVLLADHRLAQLTGCDASQITENKNYQRRSILVTIGSHSYAASMYGVPHNASEGNTIQNNNYNGQFCIHFTNSSTHGTKKVDSDHQKAIQTAYTDAVTTLSQMGYTFN